MHSDDCRQRKYRHCQKFQLEIVAADVCRVLEIGNPSQALTRLDDDEKNTLVITEGNRGNPNVNVVNESGMYKLDDDEKAKFNLGLPGGDTNVVNESGLYALVLKSRKSNAKKFRKWLTGEVVPSIFRTGSYSVAPADKKSPLRRVDLFLKLKKALDERNRY